MSEEAQYRSPGRGLRCDRCGGFPHALIFFVGKGELMLCKTHVDEGAEQITDEGGEIIELHLDKPMPEMPKQAPGEHDQAVKPREEDER